MGTFVTLARPRAIWAMWADLINHRPSVALQTELLTRFAPNSGFFHPIEDGWGFVNIDLYPVRVDKLPTLNGATLTPEALLRHVRLNINDFLDQGVSHFEPYEPKYRPSSSIDKLRWESAGPEGAVLSIDMFLLGKNVDDGSVVCSLFEPKRWRFSTLHTPQDGQHPVSGNREFGFFWTQEGWLLFYVRGADRLTGFHHELGELGDIAFSVADDLWCSYQQKLCQFIQDNGGSAVVEKSIWERHPWSGIKLILFHPTVPRLK
jgi:hypothetical protein